MLTGHARAPVEKWAGYASTPYMDEAELCTKLAFVNGGEIKIYSGVKLDDNTVITAKQVKALQKRNALLEEENIIARLSI